MNSHMSYIKKEITIETIYNTYFTICSSIFILKILSCPSEVFVHQVSIVLFYMIMAILSLIYTHTPTQEPSPWPETYIDISRAKFIMYLQPYINVIHMIMYVRTLIKCMCILHRWALIAENFILHFHIMTLV